MKRRVYGTLCRREPLLLERGAEIPWKMALELRTDLPWALGCDGMRPLWRKGIFVPIEVFSVRKK